VGRPNARVVPLHEFVQGLQELDHRFSHKCLQDHLAGCSFCRNSCNRNSFLPTLRMSDLLWPVLL